jgi:hypothetical protein
MFYNKPELSYLSGSFWALTGNTGTNASNNFIGTTDNVPLIVKTNNLTRFVVRSDINQILVANNQTEFNQAESNLPKFV